MDSVSSPKCNHIPELNASVMEVDIPGVGSPACTSMQSDGTRLVSTARNMAFLSSTGALDSTVPGPPPTLVLDRLDAAVATLQAAGDQQKRTHHSAYMCMHRYIHQIV